MAKQEYPKWIYSAGGVGMIVPDAEAHANAGPGWYESPADVPAAEPVDEGAGTPSVSSPVAPAAETAADPTADPAAAAAAVDDGDKATALYKAAVPMIVKNLKGASKAVLEDVVRLEQVNPKGARKGVIDAAQAALSAIA